MGCPPPPHRSRPFFESEELVAPIWLSGQAPNTNRELFDQKRSLSCDKLLSCQVVSKIFRASSNFCSWRRRSLSSPSRSAICSRSFFS